MAQLHQVFFSAPDPRPGVQVPLTGEDADHLLKVLRLREGYSLRAVHRESGRVFDSVLEEYAGRPGLRLMRELEIADSVMPIRRLICAMTKGKNPELVCEKATELGVPSIAFFKSDHSVVILKPDAIEPKCERFERIAEAASKQSKQTQVPKIELFPSLDTLLAADASTSEPTRWLCAALARDAAPLASVYCAGDPVSLCIGPEGDWSERELGLFRIRGFSLVSLGPHTLRSETAAIAGVAMILALSESRR